MPSNEKPRVHESGPTVSVGELRRIAALARLRLGPEEAERLARDVSSILDYMAVLGTAPLEPGANPPGGGDPARSAAASRQAAPDDPPVPPDPAPRPPGRPKTVPDRLALPPSAFAPEWREGFFVVPRLPGVSGWDGEADGRS